MFKEMEFSTYHEIIAWELRHSIRRYADMWISVLCKEPTEHQLYGQSMEQMRLSVVVFASCLLESSINFFLCTQCTAVQFEKFDKFSLADKWAKLPKNFAPNYELTHELQQDLQDIIARRKAIVHAKPKISIDGDNRHAGNEPPGALDEHEFIGRCCTLPFRLIEHLLGFKGESDTFALLSDVRLHCGIAADEFEKADRRIGWYTNVPPALVDEIMAQGHKRETAVEYAVQIGGFPHRDTEGNILVKATRKVTIQLKPLEFFQNT
jgi:hypothetical protein